jgi:hypothetical protein
VADKQILRAIAEAPESVGFARALALARVKLAPKGAPVALVLFPDPAGSTKRLVLVEPGGDGDGLARLLVHYARALSLGERAIEQFRTVARAARDADEPPRKMSYKRVLGTWDRGEARDLLRTGRALAPQEIALVVAVPANVGGGQTRRVASVLKRHHALDVRLALVDGDRVRLADLE